MINRSILQLHKSEPFVLFIVCATIIAHKSIIANANYDNFNKNDYKH